MATNFIDTSDFIGRALLVQGISSVHSQYQTVDKLTIHFQRKSNKGGDVTKVLYPLDSNRDAAIVVFDDAKDRDSTLHHQHEFCEVFLQVQRLPPLFRFVEVEIDPVYATLLPDVVHNMMKSYGNLRSPGVDTQQFKLSFSCPNELRHVEETVYQYIARRSETALFSSAATGYSDPEQVKLTEQKGTHNNRYQPENVDPEVFIGQPTTKRENTAPHAAVDRNIEENATSTSDVQMRGPIEQINDNNDDGSYAQKENSLVLEMFSYNFLMKFEKAAVEKILKKYHVRLSNKEEAGFSVKVTFVHCKSQQSTGEIQKAVDEFTALYQNTLGKINKKAVDCPPSINADVLENAESQTSQVFRNNALITKVNGHPVRYVFLSSINVDEVVQHFKKFAGIKPSKKLKTPSFAFKDTNSASAHSGPQFGNTNRSDQDERESHFHSTPSYSSSLNATRNPNKTQSLGGLGNVHFVTNEGITIYVQKGDITMQRVNAIVSPCQGDLNHPGGAAKAIMEAAGVRLERWCHDYMKRHNFYQLNVMQCLISPGFNLCPTIIHAKGPNSSYNQTFVKDLYHTFLNCLVKAEDHKIASLAIPLIGSGSIGAPKKDCAGALAQAILDFGHRRNKTECLRDIHLVNIDSKACEAIKLSFEEKFQTTITKRSDPAAAIAKDDIPDAAHGMSKEGDRLPGDKDVQSDFKLEAVALSEDYSNQIKSDRTCGTKTSSLTPKTSSSDDRTADDECPICLQVFIKNKGLPEEVLSCKHRFCKTCINQYLQEHYRCPVCRAVCGQPKGNQPKGTMTSRTDMYDLPGFRGDGTITINYDIPSGIQSKNHPHPGKFFTGVTRTAFLPDNQEGREVLSLLRKAFDARLVFTVGQSVTSGIDDIVTWNDIHHKTSQTDGIYGYPDPGYLKRVKEDLAALGIV